MSFCCPRNGGRKWYSVPFTHRYVYHGEKANVILYGPAMVDVNGTVYHLRTDMCTQGKRLMSFCCPRNGEVILKKLTKDQLICEISFSPRNGEVILK